MVGGNKLDQQRIALHVLFWVVYVVLSGIITGITDHTYWLGLRAEMIMLPVKVFLTYFILNICVPIYANRKKRLQAILLTSAGFLIAMLLYRVILISYLSPVLYPERPPLNYWSARGFYLVAFDLFTVVAAALAFKLFRLYYRIKERESTLEKEKIRSELRFLRAQTNPHYLFNTLNTIYGLALRKDDNTAEAVLRLSKIMDYTLHESRKAAVPLENELAIILDIIDLEKMRFNKRPEVNIEVDIDDPNAQIAPLLLIPFVENAFKHGVASAPDNPFVHICLKLDEDQLEFTVSNNFRKGHPVDESSDAIGLNNVQRQLELLYSKTSSLSIEKSDTEHFVQLKLNLKELSDGLTIV